MQEYERPEPVIESLIKDVRAICLMAQAETRLADLGFIEYPSYNEYVRWILEIFIEYDIFEP